MSTIYVEIKNEKNKVEENGEKWAIYELEGLTGYGSSDYSSIKLGYEEEKNLERFGPNKKLSITVNDDRTSVDGNMIIIPRNHWNAKKTVKQEIGDTSNEWVGKLGEWIESDRLKQGALAGKYWWALPAAIVLGMLIFGLIVYWAIKGISKSRD